MKSKELIEILKSGEFTIAYHDNGYCELYKGKHSYNGLREKDKIDGFSYSDGDGYIPPEVALLVKALSGRVVTI